MAEAESKEVECGFCLLREGLESPKSLPCGHSHCSVCLTKNVDVNDLIRCPWCREVFNVNIDSLPSANTEDNSLSCDVCTKKKLNDVPAIIYCTICRKLFCRKHDQSHDDTNDDHQKMTISDYRIQAKRLERRVCPKHTDHQICQGCSVCVQLFCVQCMSQTNLCVGGSAHKIVSLGNLIQELISLDKLTDRENKMADLYKQISKTISDFETETSELLSLLHTQRDEQLTEIRLKYEVLEEKFLASRKKTKEALDAYMEREVGTVLSELSNSRMKIEAQLKQSHQVDLVEGHTEIEDKIQRLLIEIPNLELRDIISLEVKEEKRDVEVDAVSVAGLSISLDQGVTTSTFPKSVKLLQSVDVSDYCFSVCKYKGNIYVGICYRVDRVDESYNVTKSFLSSTEFVYGITVCKDQLVTLVGYSNWKVHVYDLNGNQVTSWSHGDSCGKRNKLAIVDNQLVVPNRQHKKLTLYSLNGEVIKHVPCSTLGNGDVALCAADGHSVVVSDMGSSQVFKFDLTTEKVIWACKDVSKPQGVTCYRNRYILVTNRSSKTTIWVLDVETGKQLHKIEDPIERGDSEVSDLHLYEDTLVVPRRNERKVLLYHMN